MKKTRVILKRCESYSPEKLYSIIREGMKELGEKPHGKILIKPNVVTSNKRYIHHSFTEPALVEAMVKVLREISPGAAVTIGESGGIGMPTRLFFKDAGYYRLSRKIKVPVVDFNEQQTVKISLKKAKHHKTMLVAKSLYEADYKIWMPKLKYHIVTQITNAVKLNMGILTHRERFLYHDDRLNEKIIDLLEPGYPDLIVTDAVVIGRGFESSPYPVKLGAVLIAKNPLAADAVAAKILNYDPREVGYLVEAEKRGYGSIDFNDIEISGDISVEELARKTRGIESEFQDLQKVPTSVKFYEGVNPDSGNICFGGCICSIKGVLGTAEKKYPGTLERASGGAIVMGRYKGDVIHPDSTVALIGTCSAVEGRLEAKKIIRIKGCPVKVKDLMIFLLYRYKIKSPAWDIENIIRLAYNSLVKLLMQATAGFRKKSRL